MESYIFSITKETKELFLKYGINVTYRRGTGPGFYDTFVEKDVVPIRPTCLEVNMSPYTYIFDRFCKEGSNTCDQDWRRKV